MNEKPNSTVLGKGGTSAPHTGAECIAPPTFPPITNAYLTREERKPNIFSTSSSTFLRRLENKSSVRSGSIYHKSYSSTAKDPQGSVGLILQHPATLGNYTGTSDSKLIIAKRYFIVYIQDLTLSKEFGIEFI
ncbi:hypothetical protein CBL_03229 [Carabus blaptoides fortunei]